MSDMPEESCVKKYHRMGSKKYHRMGSERNLAWEHFSDRSAADRHYCGGLVVNMGTATWNLLPRVRANTSMQHEPKQARCDSLCWRGA